jgi:hypothetical protein
MAKCSLATVLAFAFALSACAQREVPVATPATAPDPAKAPYPKMAPLEEYLMDRDAEIALAKSSAPAPISDDATVLVLTRTGYETAIEGKNGFVCIVERAWTSPFSSPEFWNPKGRSPCCMNAPAARSALPLTIKRTALVLEGLTKEQMVIRLKELIAQKAFPAPEVGSMSYMMSKRQYTSDNDKPDVHWHPHLMFYVPGDMDARVWGANLRGESPVYGGGEDLPGGGRLPWTLFLVPVPKWSDGTPFVEHPGHTKREP